MSCVPTLCADLCASPFCKFEAKVRGRARQSIAHLQQFENVARGANDPHPSPQFQGERAWSRPSRATPGYSMFGMCHGARVPYLSTRDLNAKEHGDAQRFHAQLFQTPRARVSTRLADWLAHLLERRLLQWPVPTPAQ